MPLSILWKQGIPLLLMLKFMRIFAVIPARMIVNKASLKITRKFLPFICKIEFLCGTVRYVRMNDNGTNKEIAGELFYQSK